jgi:hypothetical protein
MVSFPSWTGGLKQTNFSYTWQNTFATNNKTAINLNACYDLKIFEVVTKFLGLQTDDNLNQLNNNKYNIPKLKQALWWQQSDKKCFKIRLLHTFQFHYALWSRLLGKFNDNKNALIIQKKSNRLWGM